jgi:hypothetical protein
MAKEPAERPQTAVELAKRLERCVGKGTTRRMERARPVTPVPVTPRPEPPPYLVKPTRRVRWVPLAGLLAVVLAAGVIALASGGGGDDSGQPIAGNGKQASKKKDAEETPAHRLANRAVCREVRGRLPDPTPGTELVDLIIGGKGESHRWPRAFAKS